jgi:hypothetical protein
LGGQVISRSTGVPIPDVTVNIVTAGPVCCDGHIPLVYTGPTGRFSVTLPAGTYRVLFYPAGIDGYGPAWWKGATDFESATDVVVTTKNVYLPDAALPTGRGVLGTIVDAAGQGVTGAHVDAFAADGGGFVAEGTTAPGGRFLMRLPFGTYRLLFWAPADLKLEPRWWPDAKKIDQSELITIGADGPPIDGHLGGGATQ